MKRYRQLTSEERYALSTLRKQGYSVRGIARALDRAPSTISREVRRNSRKDGGYRPGPADDFARWRRSRSRRNQRFTAAHWALVLTYLKQHWSPEQISGRLRKDGVLRISHESIYRHIWRDKRRGGSYYKLLRQAGKKRRKRYGAYDSRGRLAGKRHISERPASVETRTELGHWEIDTVLGSGRPCIVTLVERATGYVLIGRMRARTTAELDRTTSALIADAPMPVRSITADNGTEFHG
jgi:IS30 family transposase